MATNIEEQMTKKVLITGANGLLGQKLVEKLIDNPNFEVIATGIGKSRLANVWKDKYTWLQMDITDSKVINKTFDDVKPEIVIHTAAMTQVDDCENDHENCIRLNVDAVRDLIVASKKHNSHLIHLSTDFIFDGENGPYTEEAAANPVNFYGESKLQAEKLLLESGIAYSIVRTVLVYGIALDMSRSNIILWVKDSLEKGKKIQVVNDQWRTPTLAEDLADGCILIMDKKKLGIYNISGKDFLTPYEMACLTADYFQLDKTLITEVDSTIFTQPAKRPPRTGFKLNKAITELDYSPKSFTEGIGILSKQLKLADSKG